MGLNVFFNVAPFHLVLRIIPSYTWFNQVLPSSIYFYLVLPSFTKYDQYQRLATISGVDGSVEGRQNLRRKSLADDAAALNLIGPSKVDEGYDLDSINTFVRCNRHLGHISIIISKRRESKCCW